MRHHSLRLASAASMALGAASISLCAALPALAFDIPAGQSCGGLVCDLGLFGHTTAPAATAAPVFKAPARPVAVAPAGEAAQPPAGAARPVAEVSRPAASRKRVARAAAQPARAPVVLRASAEPEPVAAAPAPAPALASAPRKTRQAAPAVSTATLQDFAPAGMAMQDAAPALPLPEPPRRAEPVVLANPYVTDKPVPLAFPSVDPSVGAR